MQKITKKYLKDLSFQIIGAAIEVHKEIGPGLLEQVYEVCMVKELGSRGIKVKSQQIQKELAEQKIYCFD